MPIYFFNIDADIIEPDRYGTRLPDDDSARGQGMRLAAILAEGTPGLVTVAAPLRVRIVDEDGRLVSTVVLSLELR